MGYLNRKKPKDATKRVSWREMIDGGSKEPTFDKAGEEWLAKTDKIAESLGIPRKETENGDKIDKKSVLDELRAEKGVYISYCGHSAPVSIPDPNEAFKQKKLVASLVGARHDIHAAGSGRVFTSTARNVAVGCSAGSIGTTVIGTNYSGSTLLSDDEE